MQLKLLLLLADHTVVRIQQLVALVVLALADLALIAALVVVIVVLARCPYLALLLHIHKAYF